MTDINEWTITYPVAAGSVTYDFGALSNDQPFSVQMEIGDFARQTVDQQHGTDDAVLMGRDLAGGYDLTFTLTTVPDPADASKILTALDSVSEFAGIWRAPIVSHKPGQYAQLTNKLRDRYVLGRPRGFARKNGRLRKGVIEYIAQFETITPEFYSNAFTDLVPVRTVSTPQTIAGDLPTWPNITFTGPFATANLRWSPGGWFTPWDLGVGVALADGEQFTIGVAPWNRTAIDSSGVPRNGWLTGSKRSDCFLYPGAGGAFLFTTTGTTGANTKCEITWHDTFAGL